MNLANPTIGDIVDRLSILALKNSEETREEADQLEHMLVSRLIDASHGSSGISCSIAARIVALAAGVGAVNGRLWQLHEHPDGHPLTYAMELNHRRRALAQELSE